MYLTDKAIEGSSDRNNCLRLIKIGSGEVTNSRERSKRPAAAIETANKIQNAPKTTPVRLREPIRRRNKTQPIAEQSATMPRPLQFIEISGNVRVTKRTHPKTSANKASPAPVSKTI